MAVPAMTDYAVVGSRSVSPVSIDDQLKLLVNYARNPAEYAVNQYITISTVKKIQGIYPKFFAPDQIRLPSQTGDDMIWEDGTPIDLTKVAAGKSRRTHIKYFLTRYKREDTIGYHTIEQSEYDERRLRLNDLTNQLMTLRTLNVLTQIFLTTNWPTANVATATAWGNFVGTGGAWNAGTLTAPYLKLGLTGIRSQIVLGTNGKVKLKDLILGFDPLTAGKIAASQEVHTYLAQQSRSLAVLRGQDPDSNEDWMLPNPCYGYKVIIEATPAVIGPQVAGTVDAQVYAMTQISSNAAFVVARPGGIDSGMGSAAFSTVHVLEKSGEAMKPFVKDMGEEQMLHYCRVSDMYVPIVAAPESGALVTSVTQ